MKKIAIFVSHRIDLESETIKNPLYHHMRCGAVDDVRENIGIPGDDTGDNISDKHEWLSEFTVQYWAWKNCDADYYGLCHYRRYLSFAEQYFDCGEPHRFAVEERLDRKAARKYGLLSSFKMRREIKKYDVITSVDYPVDKLPFYPKPSNEYEVWKCHPANLVSEADIKLLLEIIKEKFPQYYDLVPEFMEQPVHKGFNCFVMRKELFNSMCEFEFGVLLEFEKRRDLSLYGGNRKRTPGYLGEILYGIYMLYLKKQENVNIKETQIILFSDTKKNVEKNLLNNKIKSKIKDFLRYISPAYRVALRIEEKEKICQAQIASLSKQLTALDKQLRRSNERTANREQLSFWLNAPVFPDDMDSIKQKFWTSYPQAEGDLRLIQMANTMVFRQLKKICDKLEIQFWLHGGSLVGAMRHQGCVPWDDDIDIGMMRTDMRKLAAYLKENNADYEVAEFYYPGLACRSYRFRHKEFEADFFVDIFPYDFYRCTTESVLSDWKKLITYKRGLLYQYRDIARRNGIVKNDVRLDDSPEVKGEIDHLIDGYIEKFEGKPEDGYIAWGIDNNFENETRYAWHHGRIFSYSDIFPLKEVAYENTACYAPAEFRKYIFAEYGIDYLEMPSNIGQPAHLNQYFGGKNIRELYEKFLMLESSDNY